MSAVLVSSRGMIELTDRARAGKPVCIMCAFAMALPRVRTTLTLKPCHRCSKQTGVRMVRSKAPLVKP